MYIGTSIFLIAVGAIGLLFSLLWMTIWADRRRGGVVADRPVAADPARERVVERDVY